MPTESVTWVFAYGSLLWRPGFKPVETLPARVQGWARRFWQGSPDHRGTPEKPGRVVTLVARSQAWTGGLAHRVPAPDCATLLGQLDAREQGGYVRETVVMECADGRTRQALTWIAASDNPHFLGPASYPEIAGHIANASGPSGTNRDYFERLTKMLHETGFMDAHVRRIARWLPAG